MADKQLWDFAVAVPSGTDVITFTTDPAVTPVLKTVSIADLLSAVTAGGNPNELQYNNGGVFGGTTGIEFGGAGIISGTTALSFIADTTFTITGTNGIITISTGVDKIIINAADDLDLVAGHDVNMSSVSDTNITATGALKLAGATLSFFGVSAVAQASAYTQTYSTAAKTVENDTAVDLSTTAATQTTPWGFASQAQADDIATQFNLLRDDLESLKKVVNAIIDDQQAYGLFQ